jgi:hypothetical protein
MWGNNVAFGENKIDRAHLVIFFPCIAEGKTDEKGKTGQDRKSDEKKRIDNSSLFRR